MHKRYTYSKIDSAKGNEMRVTYTNPGFDHSINSILLFQRDDTTPYWSDALLYFYPQLSKKKMNGLTYEGKKEYLVEELKSVWDDLLCELNNKVELYNRQFGRFHEQIEDALSETFEIDTRAIFNDIIGNISLNPVCPRFLEERYFDIFYKNSERGAIGLSIHEIIHYIWFYVWNNHFGDSYSEYETPSLKWILSEMVVESIMDDKRLASINPYYPRENGGCVYRYFQDMIIHGKPILDTLRELHQGNHITDYMELSYRYCLENEAAIRRHIKEAEKVF